MRDLFWKRETIGKQSERFQERRMDWVTRLNTTTTGRLPIPLEGTLIPVEILHWAYVASLADNVPHRHTFFEVCLMGGYGKGLYRVGGIDHILSPGDLFIARPSILHQIRNTGDRLMELTWVSFALGPGSAKPPPILNGFANASVLVIPERIHGLSALWNVALRSLAGNDSSSSETIQATVTALLTGILYAGADVSATEVPPSNGQQRGNTTERLAVRYIHDNLNRSISVQEIADQIHISPRHLTRLFEKFTGVTPAAYIERARIDRAALLLTRSSLPLKEIATSVGFLNVHHFSRTFSRLEGKPPGAFRRDEGGPIRRDAETEPEGALV